MGRFLIVEQAFRRFFESWLFEPTASVLYSDPELDVEESDSDTITLLIILASPYLFFFWYKMHSNPYNPIVFNPHQIYLKDGQRLEFCKDKGSHLPGNWSVLHATSLLQYNKFHIYLSPINISSLLKRPQFPFPSFYFTIYRTYLIAFYIKNTSAMLSYFSASFFRIPLIIRRC